MSMPASIRCAWMDVCARRAERHEQQQQVLVGGMCAFGERCLAAIVEQGVDIAGGEPVLDPLDERLHVRCLRRTTGVGFYRPNIGRPRPRRSGSSRAP